MAQASSSAKAATLHSLEALATPANDPSPMSDAWFERVQSILMDLQAAISSEHQCVLPPTAKWLPAAFTVVEETADPAAVYSCPDCGQIYVARKN